METVKKAEQQEGEAGQDATDQTVDLTPPRKQATRPSLSPEQLAAMKAAEDAANTKEDIGPVVGGIIGGAVGVATLTGFIYYLAVRNPSLSMSTHVTWSGQ